MGASGFGNSDLESKIAKLDVIKTVNQINAMDETSLNQKFGGRRASSDGLQASKDAAMQELVNHGVQQVLAGKKPSIMARKIAARRSMAGKQRNVVKKTEMSDELKAIQEQADSTQAAATMEDKTYVTFAVEKYSVLESAGTVEVMVECHRSAADKNANIHVVATTQDGTALAGDDYTHVRHEISFAPGEDCKAIKVQLIDDTEYEPDEHFLICLSAAKGGRKGKESDCEFEFFPVKIAHVTIVNDDDPGTFGFENGSYSVGEKGEMDENGKPTNHAKVKIVRTRGSDGEVTVKYKTVDGSAIGGDDFEPAVGEVVFKHQECEKTISVKLIDDDSYEKSESFTIELEVVGAPSNGAKVGEGIPPAENEGNSPFSPYPSVVVTILGDEDSAKVVNEVALLMKAQLDKLSLTTDSWGQQFDEAMNIQGEEGEDPALMDYVMHVLTFGWKVLFAVVPPTKYKDGWVTFFVALGFIGLLTAFVADIAGIFGCLLGLKDSITAITFVALGTSLPDTFASKSAAVNDETADASVGNVTGSNSVNVFLGLGLPWLLATIVHTGSAFQSDPVLSRGVVVEFKEGGYPMIAGSLGFSVVLFCICAICCIITLYIRRFIFGYELGGTSFTRNITGVFFIGLWMIYVVVSSLEVEGHIKSFM